MQKLENNEQNLLEGAQFQHLQAWAIIPQSQQQD